MHTSNFQSMKLTAAKWGGGPSFNTLPKSHLPDSKVWTIKGTPFEKLDANLKKAGYRFPWFRNEVWVYYLQKQGKPFEAAIGRHLVPGFLLFLAYKKYKKVISKNNFWTSLDTFFYFLFYELCEVAYYGITGHNNPHIVKARYLFPPACIDN